MSERQGTVPMIAYMDCPRAIAWLVQAFGFREELRRTADDGTVSHAELDTGGGIVMLATPSPDYQSPRRHADTCAAARTWQSVPWVVDGVLVYVEDVDAHFARATAHGAHILSAPEDGPPARRYRVADIEGHRWMFMQR